MRCVKYSLFLYLFNNCVCRFTSTIPREESRRMPHGQGISLGLELLGQYVLYAKSIPVRQLYTLCSALNEGFRSIAFSPDRANVYESLCRCIYKYSSKLNLWRHSNDDILSRYPLLVSSLRKAPGRVDLLAPKHELLMPASVTCRRYSESSLNRSSPTWLLQAHARSTE